MGKKVQCEVCPKELDLDDRSEIVSTMEHEWLCRKCAVELGIVEA